MYPSDEPESELERVARQAATAKSPVLRSTRRQSVSPARVCAMLTIFATALAACILKIENPTPRSAAASTPATSATTTSPTRLANHSPPARPQQTPARNNPNDSADEATPQSTATGELFPQVNSQK